MGKKKSRSVFGCCFRMNSEDTGNHHPTHLILLVNGLIGSARNWKFAAKQLLIKYPHHDLLVHCSGCNSATLTFDGVDVMADRLALEVDSLVKRHPTLERISFVAHSLGGLVARYAIAKLYQPDTLTQDSSPRPTDSFQGKIAGLHPINFITSATPHLGSRGHRQVPIFCGLYSLERLAHRTSGFLGKSGKHLFLSDTDDGKPPLLLRMATDSENLKFISALQSFRRRVAYANVNYDHLVGWSTSSLRRRDELPKLKKKKAVDEKYPHIINVEPSRITSPQETETNAIDMEDAMLKGLTKLSWERIDVSFRGSGQRILAHSTIQVKGSWINSDGADVIQHMVDNFVLI